MAELTTTEEARNDLLSCAIYLAGKINSNEAQALTLKPIILRCLEKDDVDNAAHFADIINDSFTRNQMLIAVISKCVQLDDDEYAFQLIEAIDEYGTQATARETIAIQKALKGDFAKALEIAETLEHPSHSYAAIAINQAKKGFENEALETLQRIDFHKSVVEALEAITTDCLEQKQVGKAVAFLEIALEESENIEFAEDKIRALFEIANLFVEAEKNDRAIETLAKAAAETEKIDGLHKDGLFANIAVGYLKAGSLDLADRTLDEVGDKTQVANCLVGFSQVFDKEGEKEDSLDSLEEAYAILNSQQENEIRDSNSRHQLFSAIAVQFARLEKIERAIEIAHENPDVFQTNLALANISQLCVLQGNDEMAQQATKGIDSDSQRLTALVGLSDAKNQIDKKTEAVEFLDEAVTLIETIPQFIARTDTQNELANRFGFYGETEKARKLASASLQTVGEILGNDNRSLALSELAKVFEKYDFQLSDEDKELLGTLVQKSDW